jgi:hypothetical protein
LVNSALSANEARVEVIAEVTEGVGVRGAAVVETRVSVMVGVVVAEGIEATVPVRFADTVCCTEVITIFASWVGVGVTFEPRHDESNKAAIIKQMLLRMYILQ